MSCSSECTYVRMRACIYMYCSTCTYVCVCVYMQACCGMYAKHAHIRIHISSHTCLTSCIHYISGYRYSHACIDFRWWCISASVIAAILFVFRRRDHTLFNDNVHQNVLYSIACRGRNLIWIEIIFIGHRLPYRSLLSFLLPWD